MPSDGIFVIRYIIPSLQRITDSTKRSHFLLENLHRSD